MNLQLVFFLYEVVATKFQVRKDRINYDPSRVAQDSGTYIIKLSPLSYDVEEQNIRDFFNMLEDNEIKDIRIPRGTDGNDERYKGEAFVEVYTLDAMNIMLSKDNENMNWDRGK